MPEPFLGSKFLLAAKRARSMEELHTAALGLARVVLPKMDCRGCDAEKIINAIGMCAQPSTQLMEHFRAFEERRLALGGRETTLAPRPAIPKPA